jgi:hypothetical protein
MKTMPTPAELWSRYPSEWFAKSIESLQSQQKRFPMDSKEWQEGSRRLAPLFEEMARRQKENGGEPDWRKWK